MCLQSCFLCSHQEVLVYDEATGEYQKFYVADDNADFDGDAVIEIEEDGQLEDDVEAEHHVNGLDQVSGCLRV